MNLRNNPKIGYNNMQDKIGNKHIMFFNEMEICLGLKKLASNTLS